MTVINKFYTFLSFYPSYTEVYSDDSIVLRPAETEVVEEVESFSSWGSCKGGDSLVQVARDFQPTRE